VALMNGSALREGRSERHSTPRRGDRLCRHRNGEAIRRGFAAPGVRLRARDSPQRPVGRRPTRSPTSRSERF